MAKKFPEIIGIIADLHCGSRKGLLHPDDDIAKQSPGQEYTWQCFHWLCDNWPQLDLLVLNGDLIEGKQRAQEGTEVISTDLSEQATSAELCVKHMVEKLRPGKTVRTEGSGYHEGNMGSLKFMDAKVGIKTVGVVLDIELADGHVLNVKHEPEGGQVLYKGTATDREAIWTVVHEAVSAVPHADHIVRSHYHFRYRAEPLGKIMLLTPCFQLQTRRAQIKGYRRWQPSIGGLLLTRNKDEERGYRVNFKTFKLPRVKALEYKNL